MKSMATDGRFGKSIESPAGRTAGGKRGGGRWAAADWPRVLGRILPPEFWQRFARCVPDSDDPRVRWQPKMLVLCWIFIGWIAAPGLVERFTQARAALAGLFPQRRRPGRTYAGLAAGSEKHGVEALRQFLDCLRPTVRSFLAGTWETCGWILFAVDGTRCEAPRTRSNQRRLRRAGREKCGPQWSLTALLHLPSRVLWDWRQGAGPENERGHLRAMLESLPPGALLLADAGFTGYSLLKALLDRGADFLIRCGSNVKLLIPEANVVLKSSRGGSTRVYLWPQEQRDQPPLVLRLIVLPRRGRRMYLLTSVHQRTRLPQHVAAQLYAARWGIELHYRSLKQTLGRRKLQAASPKVGAWELAGNLLALALLTLQALWRLGDGGVRASVAKLWRLVRAALERLRYGSSSRGYGTALTAAVRDEYERHRPKRSRHYPRKKREKPPGAPFLRRLTLQEKTEINRMNLQGTPRVG